MLILTRIWWYTLAIIITLPLWACAQKSRADYLVAFQDVNGESCGYKNLKGEVIIPAGRYSACFTDTLFYYAVVFEPEVGMVAIDRQGKRLYEVFLYDNGPDMPAEGLFRIMQQGKIGYANARTGQVVIPPQFDGAFPFENGVARVGLQCQLETDGEHSTWKGGIWKQIDRNGATIESPDGNH